MDDFNNYEKIRKQLASNNWNLYDYQKKFLDAVNENKYRQYLLSSEIGTGKTITSFFPFFNKSLNKINTKVIYISPLKSIISIQQSSKFNRFFWRSIKKRTAGRPRMSHGSENCPHNPAQPRTQPSAQPAKKSITEINSDEIKMQFLNLETRRITCM